MPSPFPGMNPYLERAEVWQDFHDTFIPAVREALTAQLRPRYFVKIEEHLYIHEPPASERFPAGRPDLSVGAATPVPRAATDSGAVAAPARVGLPAEFETVRIPYLEIRDRGNREVVTVLEMLSPTNKYAGADRDAYFDKTQKLLRTRTHFIELDLLRGGPRMPWRDPPACDYYALVSRHEDRTRDDPEAHLWPVRLRDTLPTIPVPLRSGEPEAKLDLQAVLHRVYDAAGYDVFIYGGPPEPRLRPDDDAWARRLLAAAGVTPA